VLTQTIFILSLICAVVILASLLISIFVPSRRIWPPPRRESWQFTLIWVTGGITVFSSLSLGALDWNSGSLDTPLRFLIGALLILGGLAFTSWAMSTLGWQQSTGLKGRFVSAGPYRLSRNPQYVGDSLALLGYAILTNSTLVLVINLIAILSFLLTPFSEEPWLRAQFGEAYEEYRRRTPRFLSLQSLFKS
jgi:protein-S-isoprenylcysteine O-methyltransferase Ste14